MTSKIDNLSNNKSYKNLNENVDNLGDKLESILKDYKDLEEYFKKQEEAHNKQTNTLQNKSEIHRPNINPSNVYNSSMPTKK